MKQRTYGFMMGYSTEDWVNRRVSVSVCVEEMEMIYGRVGENVSGWVCVSGG